MRVCIAVCGSGYEWRRREEGGGMGLLGSEEIFLKTSPKSRICEN